MLAFAPSPEDIALALWLHLLLPLATVVVAVLLRRRLWWCVGFCSLVIGFYVYLFREANPATSSRRADITFLVQDIAGHPIPNVSFETTQYPVGDGHPTGHGAQDQTLTTDASGRATLITTSHRRITATFRVPNYRYASIHIDREWHPTFQVAQYDFSWGVLPWNEKTYGGNSTSIQRRINRDHPLTIPVVLASTTDEDASLDERLREVLPNDA